MSAEPFIGEISLMSFSAIPRGWLPCQGQLMSVAQNTALFSVLGTKYGGNGITNFALPDLTDRVPIGMGSGYTIGVKRGDASHALTAAEMPRHTHVAQADAKTTSGLVIAPSGTTVLGQSLATATSGTISVQLYDKRPATGALAPASVAPSGNGQPHNNMMSYLPIGFCIAISGIYPSRN